MSFFFPSFRNNYDNHIKQRTYLAQFLAMRHKYITGFAINLCVIESLGNCPIIYAFWSAHDRPPPLAFYFLFSLPASVYNWLCMLSKANVTDTFSYIHWCIRFSTDFKQVWGIGRTMRITIYLCMYVYVCLCMYYILSKQIVLGLQKIT